MQGLACEIADLGLTRTRPAVADPGDVVITSRDIVDGRPSRVQVLDVWAREGESLALLADLHPEEAERPRGPGREAEGLAALGRGPASGAGRERLDLRGHQAIREVA